MAVVINSATRKCGQVKMFDSRTDKMYGFASVQGSTLEVFFHLNARLSFAEDDHYPRQGEWISFEMTQGRKGVKAIAWQLEPDYIPPAIVSGIRQHFDISQLPTIGSEQIEEWDEIVGGVDGYHGSSRVEWFEIIYRPLTRELFKVACWDSAGSSYQTDLAGGILADVTFGNKHPWQRIA